MSELKGLRRWEPSQEDVERYNRRGLHGAIVHLELGPEDWALMSSLRAYADDNDLSLAEAIRALLILGFLGRWVYPGYMPPPEEP